MAGERYLEDVNDGGGGLWRGLQRAGRSPIFIIIIEVAKVV
jgi:hypothetical protein